MGVEKLSEQKHWESINSPVIDDEQLQKKSKKLFKIFTYSYTNYLLWDVVLPQFIKQNYTAKVIEVGSAPGKNLVKWHKQFGHIPFGVEYTESGTEINRKLFVQNNLDPENIIKADFLSEEFLNLNSEKYDFVYSMGFIEHFDDPEIVIFNHLKILKTGGILFISIPNLKGLYGFLLKIFYPEILKIHNLNIMELHSFKKLFEYQVNLEFLYCNYKGTIDLNILQFGKFKVLNKFSHYFQMILNFFCKILFGKKGFETKQSSPYIIFIGRKK